MSRPLHRYGHNSARHYRAYRPPLHQTILSRALGSSRWNVAVDIGCGTGWSTKALTQFAEQIIGVDNNPEMLAANEEAKGIEFRLGNGNDLPVETGTVSLVTMAGVLPYLDKTSLVREIQRIAAPSALVLVYDFRVEMGPLLKRLPVGSESIPSHYNHADNLDDVGQLEALGNQTQRVSFSVSATEAAHLVLSSDRRFRRLSDHCAGADPLGYVESQLSAPTVDIAMEAKTWSALYRVRPSTP